MRIGTRGSRLALAQAGIVSDLLARANPAVDFEIVPVKTLGDLLPPEKRVEVDGKSAFTSEIDELLLAGELDAAVHSMKDLPAVLGNGLAISATPSRGDFRDALVSKGGMGLAELGTKPVIGTSSVRRKAQISKLRPDAQVVELHGNVETRLRKMAEGQFDAIVLAAAGLERLGMSGRISQYFGPDEILPAACQGVLAIESRSRDRETSGILRKIDDPTTHSEAACERSFVQALGGDCYVPIAAHANRNGGSLTATGMLSSIDGKKLVRSRAEGRAGEPEALGSRLANMIIESGGREIMLELSA